MSASYVSYRDRPKLQRPTNQVPIVHLESAIPAPSPWEVTVGGLVENEKTWSLEEVRAFPSEERVLDLHCVWGWTQAGCRWEGIPAGRLIEAARPLPSAEYVTVGARESPYASCLTLAEAMGGFIAYSLDGRDLPPERGGPLRFVPPPTKWGYKGVKWMGSITLIATFTPGFWEELVGNPVGDIPPQMLDMRYEKDRRQS